MWTGSPAHCSSAHLAGSYADLTILNSWCPQFNRNGRDQAGQCRADAWVTESTRKASRDECWAAVVHSLSPYPQILVSPSSVIGCSLLPCCPCCVQGQHSIHDPGTMVPALLLALGGEGCIRLAVSVPFLGTLPLYSESQAAAAFKYSSNMDVRKCCLQRQSGWRYRIGNQICHAGSAPVAMSLLAANVPLVALPWRHSTEHAIQHRQGADVQTKKREVKAPVLPSLTQVVRYGFAPSHLWGFKAGKIFESISQ